MYAPVSGYRNVVVATLGALVTAATKPCGLATKVPSEPPSKPWYVHGRNEKEGDGEGVPGRVDDGDGEAVALAATDDVGDTLGVGLHDWPSAAGRTSAVHTPGPSMGSSGPIVADQLTAKSSSSSSTVAPTLRWGHTAGQPVRRLTATEETRVGAGSVTSTHGAAS